MKLVVSGLRRELRMTVPRRVKATKRVAIPIRLEATMPFPRILSRLLHHVITAHRSAATFGSAALVLAVSCTDSNSPTLAAPASPSFATSACTLGLTDAEARATISDLTAAVNALEASGVLNSGQANALRGHLLNILKSIDAGNYCAAKSQLQAFKDQVKNFVDGGILTPQQGETLTGPATEVIEGVIRFARIQAGHLTSCGLSTDGTAYCWGANAVGQVGDGTTTDRLIATRVATNLKFAQISGGGSHMCALTSDGVAYCWGFNGDGQLGDGTTSNRSTPTAISTNLRFTSITAAGSGVFYGAGGSEAGYLAGGHTCGLTSTGAAYCWGYNRWGTSGDGTEVGHLTPTAAAPGLAFTSITTWENHTCGITTTGETKCWGLNVHGQLGNGTTSLNITVPVTVLGGITFTSLSAGWQHTCGITSTGASSCWGLNLYGELGDGTTTDRLTPTPVSSALAWSSISAGGWLQTCGLATTGAAYCWGSNLNGVSLGTGTPSSQLIPAAVGPGLGLQFAAIHTGIRHSCAITTSNRAYCWGDNVFGALGDGTTADRGLPVAVKGAP
jgi:alpha-tubulin suppressor-like RCC1 family protein